MNKIVLGLGFAALLVAAAALAQPAGPPPGGGSDGADNGPGPQGRGPGFFMRRPAPHPPALSKGAQFRFGEGNRRVLVKCADDDSTKACLDAVGPLLNKILETK